MLTMSNNAECTCSRTPALIFSCSGAADTGEVADRVARKLTKGGLGKMYCLAGIGGNVSSIKDNTKAAGKIIAIDGCPMDCAAKTLVEAGFRNFEHVKLADIGLQKGKSPANEENISKVTDFVLNILEK